MNKVFRRSEKDERGQRLWLMGKALPALPPADGTPDWVQANPRFIERASQAAQSRSGGGWVVLDASRRITDAPRRFDVAGQEWVVWRDQVGQVNVAPNACPHMGARLSDGFCEHGKVVCPWHGLALKERRGAWTPMPAHDDGVLVWARLLQDEVPSDAPVVPARAAHVLEGTLRVDAKCEPEDVVANRLDPWHGAHYHPHSFARLRVLDASEERIDVRVTYRAFGTFGVEVDCTFEAPTRRSIVMTITGGEGIGSVVETHATPIATGRCTIIESTLVSSERPGVQNARLLSRMIRPIIEKRAGKLWVEDIAYAERRYEMRAAQDATRHLKVVGE